MKPGDANVTSAGGSRLEDRARLELAGLVADLSDFVAWEKSGGGVAWPRTPPSERFLPDLASRPANDRPAARRQPGPPRAAAGQRPPYAPEAQETAPAGGPPCAPSAAGHPASPLAGISGAPAAVPAGPLPGGKASQAGDLDSLRAVLGDCRRCKLASSRRTIVFGQGKPNANLLLVGEAPGFHEDRQGLAFVGPAGKLLTRILGAIQLQRHEVYICNIVKCRPPRNRDPEEDEVAACRPFVERQIELVQPKVVLCLGRIAAQTLFGTTAPLHRLRERFLAYRGIPVRVTYHPAAILRDRSKKRPVWEDVQAVRDKLAEGQGSAQE